MAARRTSTSTSAFSGSSIRFSDRLRRNLLRGSHQGRAFDPAQDEWPNISFYAKCCGCSHTALLRYANEKTKRLDPKILDKLAFLTGMYPAATKQERKTRVADADRWGKDPTLQMKYPDIMPYLQYRRAAGGPQDSRVPANPVNPSKPSAAVKQPTKQTVATDGHGKSSRPVQSDQLASRKQSVQSDQLTSPCQSPGPGSPGKKVESDSTKKKGVKKKGVTKKVIKKPPKPLLPEAEAPAVPEVPPKVLLGPVDAEPRHWSLKEIEEFEAEVRYDPSSSAARGVRDTDHNSHRRTIKPSGRTPA